MPAPRSNPSTGFSQAITVLNDGRVDAVVNDSITVLAYQAEHPDAPIKVAATIPDERSEQAFAARKDSGLLPELNKALDELRADGTLTKISKKYLDVGSVEGQGRPVPGS